MAGAARDEAASPAAPTLRNSRRFMGMFPPDPGILGRDATRRGVVWIRKFPVDRPPDAACARGKTRDTPRSGCDIDVQLHLRMDAAEHQERTGGGEADLNRLAGLLRPESKSSAGSNIRTLWVRVSLLTIHNRSPRASAIWLG